MFLLGCISSPLKRNFMSMAIKHHYKHNIEPVKIEFKITLLASPLFLFFFLVILKFFNMEHYTTLFYGKSVYVWRQKKWKRIWTHHLTFLTHVKSMSELCRRPTFRFISMCVHQRSIVVAFIIRKKWKKYFIVLILVMRIQFKSTTINYYEMLKNKKLDQWSVGKNWESIIWI